MKVKIHRKILFQEEDQGFVYMLIRRECGTLVPSPLFTSKADAEIWARENGFELDEQGTKSLSLFQNIFRPKV